MNLKLLNQKQKQKKTKKIRYELPKLVILLPNMVFWLPNKVTHYQEKVTRKTNARKIGYNSDFATTKKKDILVSPVQETNIVNKKT